MYIKEQFYPLSGEGRFGIDKLHLFTDAYEIGSTKEWNVQPNVKAAGQEHTQENIITTIATGEQVCGKKMFINTEHYTAEVKHGLLWVHFNPSKFHHAYNLTADSQKIADTLHFIEQDIKHRGLGAADIFSANVGRADITAQDLMNYPTQHYHPVIRSAQHLKRAPRTEYPDGYLIGQNKKQQICFYDKGLKLQMDAATKHTHPTNLSRIETRFNNAATIKRHTAFKTVADLISGDVMQKMKFTYSKQVNRLLNLNQLQVQLIEQGTLTNLLRTLMQHYPRQYHAIFPGVIFAMTGTGNAPSRSEIEYALHTISAEQGLSVRSDKIGDKLNRIMDAMHTTKIMAAGMSKQAEDNYAAIHTEFKEKLILPYAI
jgi:hypothetical protein